MADEEKQSAEELAAIEAELEALGESPLDAGEVASSERFGADLEDGPEHGPLEGLSLLRLKSAAASLSAERSASLFGSVLAKAKARGPEELRDDLQNLGEPDLGELEYDRSQSLAQVADALASSAALAEAPEVIEGAGEMAEELQTLAALRVAAAHVGEERSASLLEKVVEESGMGAVEAADNVVHLGSRRRSTWAPVLAAAAALLMVVASAAVWSLLQGPAPNEPVASVSQVELERAEDQLSRVESSALKTLMASQTAPAGQNGDHFLRNLRQARSDASRARRQARVRRL